MVLAVTCEWHGMVGVGKVMSAEGSDGEEEDSDSSLWIKLSCMMRAAASSSSLGVPQCLRARVIQMISSISPMYVLPQLMLLRTLVMVAKRA